MAGDDEAGSDDTTADADRTKPEDATTADAPPSDGTGEGPEGGDDDPSADAAAGPAGDGDESDDPADAAAEPDETTAEPGGGSPEDDDDNAGDNGGAATPGPEFDADAAEARLKEVEEQIEEGRRALADVAQETDAEPDSPPVAEGETNAPPG